MRKKPNPNRMLSWMLVVIMLIGMMPTTVFGSGGEVIASFSMPVTELIVEAGTKKLEIPLPEMLAATLEDGRTIDIPVSWDGGLYNKDVAGVYTFTADYGASYVYRIRQPQELHHQQQRHCDVEKLVVQDKNDVRALAAEIGVVQRRAAMGMGG